LIKYLGSKRTIVPSILRIIEALPDVSTVVDLFSGTSRVGHALKRAGKRVLANDHNAYAATLARCYVVADREEVAEEAGKRISALNGLAGRRGYFTRTFCEESRFFRPKNGRRVDAMRDRIAAWKLGEELEAVLLTSLMEAADRVDSTTGVQMAYLKRWAPRAHDDIRLRLPDVLPMAVARRIRWTRPGRPVPCRGTWRTSIPRTTSTGTSGTTTSGRHWSSGTHRTTMAWPARERTAG
jgi:adenine-specific DNA-methyltransferase